MSISANILPRAVNLIVVINYCYLVFLLSDLTFPWFISSRVYLRIEELSLLKSISKYYPTMFPLNKKSFYKNSKSTNTSFSVNTLRLIIQEFARALIRISVYLKVSYS